MKLPEGCYRLPIDYVELSFDFVELSFLRRRSNHLGVLALLLLLVIGCDRQRIRDASPRRTVRIDSEPTSPKPARDTSPVMQPSAMPETRTDTMTINGKPDTVTLRLVGAGWPFSTYVPEDIETNQESSEDGVSYLFYANFKGKLNKDIYMEMFFPPKNRIIDDVKEDITGKHGYARDNGWTLGDREEAKCPWADYSYRIKAGGQGYICIGRESGRTFVLTVHYTAPFAEAFMPRVEKMLGELQWKSTGRGLERE